MIERLNILNDESAESGEDSSSDNSNYDFELEQNEAKDLWKKHLADEFESYDSRFKSRVPFKNAFSPIYQESSNFKDIEFEFDESNHRNFDCLKSKAGRNSLACLTKEPDHSSEKSHKVEFHNRRRRKVCHRRSSSLMDKVCNDVKFSVDADNHGMTIEKSDDAYKSSDFNTTKMYLSEIDRRNKKKCIEQSKIHKKSIKKFKKEHLKIGKTKGKVQKLKISKKLQPNSKEVDIFSTESDV